MRVITGTARGRKLVTVEGEEIVRPTADAVKEAIFSAIQFEIRQARVLDLFAGSGQLGIEALSRGAKEAYFVDNSKESIEVIRTNLTSTGFLEQSKICAMPFKAFLRNAGAMFDIALLDPPYRYGLIQKALPELENIMSENGIIICEHEKECALPQNLERFEISRVLRHSKTLVTIYRPKTKEENDR